MTNTVLQCSQLTKTYSDGATKVEVLKQINFEVKPAETIAIVGSSGSGKTTLLHLLGGLDKPTGGDVIVAGKNLAHLSESARCKLRNQYLGFVYQFHHLLPEFTALENVCISLMIRKINPKIAKEKSAYLLEKVGLKERLHHKIGELSGGERQRTAIARALVTDPLCVLADEPTGNLDPRNAEKVLELFIELQKAHQTSVVLVTHDRNITQHVQKVLTIEDGKLIAAS